MRKWQPLLILFISCIPYWAVSQELNGRVLRESGDRASGVNVYFQNRKNNITTNPDGTFRIRATHLPDTLVFDAPGYEPYKVVINEKNIKDPEFEVVMLNERKRSVGVPGFKTAAPESAMSEVVVTTAYGTSSRSGSGSMYEKDYAGSELAGRVPGLKVSGYSSFGAGPGSYKLFFADTNIAPRTGIAAKSRILTAGEVNDFNKWNMWEEYTGNEFKSMRNFWGMNPVNRFSVQYTDKRFNAIINEPVFLVNRVSGDTVWRARTDNTGKAELWAGFLGNGTEAGDYYITDRMGNQLARPSAFANGVNLLTADRSCGISNEVDIAFVVDATGSMGDEIEFLKLELEDVIRNTMEQYSKLSLRAASVFYRDKGDIYITRQVPFHDDLLKSLNFIKLQSAAGGGDTPEALDDALKVALDSLQWNPSARTRLLFLVLDAPPHNEAKERIQQLIVKAAAMGVRIVPVACSGTDKSTEFLLRTMALATNGTYTFLTNHSAVGNPHIEPTTDKYEVELLGNLLQRIIKQYLFARDCEAGAVQQAEPNRQPANVLSVKLYPNPTSGVFTIESKAEIREMYITDFTGKILMRLGAAGKKGRWEVNIGAFPSGTYLVKYITPDNKWGAEKVLLMR